MIQSNCGTALALAQHRNEWMMNQ
uniref:Uncharacterized protein n=1 Tax=Arundo donax TaxID=35708 RepID=A0A0A8YSF6_ARUDO